MMSKEDKSKIKVGIAIAAFTVVFYLLLQNINSVKSAFISLLGLLSSFIAGICIAFVLNILIVFFEQKLFPKIKFMNKPKVQRFKRAISLTLTLLIFLGIIAALLTFVIPQFVASAKQLATNIPSYLSSLEKFTNNVLASLGISTTINETITTALSQVSDYILTFISDAVPKIFETTINITSGILNMFLGFVFAIYMLASKESLLKNSKRVLYAFLPLKVADYIKDVYRLIKKRFSGFVTGQLIEAVIVGILCFIGMTIFQMEYAPLISVIVGVTNMIPIVGPIIGAIPGALIMLMVDPMMALWFVIFIIALQQLESNLIYPKVVGDSIGLPGIFVLFAIIIGGNFFGFLGVLLGVPTFAVLYTILAKHTSTQLKKKGLSKL